jgi:hypothetical protein
MTTVSWVTAFLDLPPDVHEAGTRFWAAATGYAVSPARGAEGEFLTLVPPHADPFLKVQRTGTDGGEATGPSVHLDLHVASPDAAAARAESLGAEVVRQPPDGYVVMRSPGGFVFCFVRERRSARPPATKWAHGHESLVDQVCLDISPGDAPREETFWAELTDWELRSSARPEFRHLVRPAELPIRLLLQRRDDDAGPVTGHLDIATDDRETEVERHVALGATRLDDVPGARWTVLRDPAGAAYCITDRDPGTGLLA